MKKIKWGHAVDNDCVWGTCFIWGGQVRNGLLEERMFELGCECQGDSHVKFWGKGAASRSQCKDPGDGRRPMWVGHTGRGESSEMSLDN